MKTCFLSALLLFGCGLVYAQPNYDENLSTTNQQEAKFGCMTLNNGQKLCGDEALKRYLATNLRYPDDAMENGVQGEVSVSFWVKETGELGTASITKDIGHGCGQEVLRLLSKMPLWMPATEKGQPVMKLVSLKVAFKLN